MMIVYIVQNRIKDAYVMNDKMGYIIVSHPTPQFYSIAFIDKLILL